MNTIKLLISDLEIMKKQDKKALVQEEHKWSLMKHVLDMLANYNNNFLMFMYVSY